jgi:reactive intermediate/imine deaminase
MTTIRFASVTLLLLTTALMGFAQTERRAINIRTGTAAALPFSDGVLVGNTLYLAGRLGLDPATNAPPKEIEQEVTLLLDGFTTVLAKAGMTMEHLVYVQVFCPDLALYSKFNEVYRTYFQKEFPARAFIGSGPLLFGAHFEMQGIAVK